MDKIETICQEIERLQQFNHNMADLAINSNMRAFYEGEEDCCKQLLSFLDALSKKPVCLDDGGAPSKQKCGDCTIACSVRAEEEPDKSLEEAADNFAHWYDQGTCDRIAQDCFIAGAKWQAEQDDRDVVFWKGMKYAIAGMKEDAVGGIYTKSMDGKNVFVESGALKIDPASVNVGDKVKLIIIKDDGKSD